MADISTELQAILDALYGEDVRGSIHDAIEKINDVSEATLTVGTAITSASSSVTGFYENSVYINKSTWDVWKCTGLAWSLQGNIKGGKGDVGDTGVTPVITASASIDNNTGTPGVTVTKTGTAENPNLTFSFTNLKGVKGDKGDAGDTGVAGNGISGISKTGTSGNVDTYTIAFTDGTTATFTVTNGTGYTYISGNSLILT